VNLRDLIDSYREEAADNGRPPFVSDQSLIRFANEAQREACRRGRMLVDSTSAVCTVGIVAGEPLVELDQSIIYVRRARLSSNGTVLRPASIGEMDEWGGRWDSSTGQPIIFLQDFQTGYLRLYPIPTNNDDLLLTVSRMPLSDMSDDSDEPEVRAEVHPAIVQWMLYRAYSRQDSDMFDQRKAATSLAEFEREFGKRASARNEQWSRAGVVMTEPIA
jgi:hypothetical protein